MRAVEGVGEFAWVIERGDAPAYPPSYWMAGAHDAAPRWAWTPNHMEAIRFARHIDAERVSQRVLKGIPVRVVEHGWAAPASDRDGLCEPPT